MKKILIFSLFCLLAYTTSAETPVQAKDSSYQFTVIKENPITSIKNQGNSGTCWCFSSMAFLESEAMRQGTATADLNLSEMYIVHRNYEDKTTKYVRLGGKLNLGQGGSFADAIQSINDYGLVPYDVMTGLNYGEKTIMQNELEGVLIGYCENVVKNLDGHLTTAWHRGVDGILDAYLGKDPQNFTYNGASYTPQSFAKSLKLDADNYISFTSYTHHPFYSKFAVEVPDNWRWADSYNLPLDEMMQVIDNALENGYTVAWGGDVSEIGFTRTGLGVIPDEDSPQNEGSDQAHWLGLSQKTKDAQMAQRVEKCPLAEKTITPEMRQLAYDNYGTTDDHGMQIFGIAKDQYGKKFYMVKNSWGKAGKYKGIWYMSEAYIRYKTMDFIVNKNSVPASIMSKLKM